MRLRDALCQMAVELDGERHFQRFREMLLADHRPAEVFAYFAGQLRAAGRKHGSADAICHRMRWESAISTTVRKTDWKINNNFTAYFARLLPLMDPSFVGFFETRRSPRRGDE